MAAYSLKPDTDPSLERRRICLATSRRREPNSQHAIGDAAHTRSQRRGSAGFRIPAHLSRPCGSPAAPIRTCPFRPVMPRAATRQAIADFIEIEAQSTGVDGLYNNILATLQFPPADVASFVTDEWKQAIRSIIAEGEDHFETFLDIQEWLSNHAENGLFAPAGAASASGRQRPEYRLLCRLCFPAQQSSYGLKGRRSHEINVARSAMVGAGGIVAKGSGGEPEFPGRIHHASRCTVRADRSARATGRLTTDGPSETIDVLGSDRSACCHSRATARPRRRNYVPQRAAARRNRRGWSACRRRLSPCSWSLA